MKNLLYILLCIGILSSCNNSTDEGDPIIPDLVSPVVLDLANVPYQTLSEYNFFTSPMSAQQPVYGVLPYEPINQLFTDYAHKKRFIWLPEDTQVAYVSDNEPFNFPNGSAVIKNFYYDNVQPSNSTKILETRLMIRKNNEWIFATYVWNNEQTEAYLDLNGSDVPISFMEGNEVKTANYRIPSEAECFTCHNLADIPMLIGPKPRNINSDYTYEEGTFNQIDKWVELGYLSSTNLPNNIGAVPNWKNTSNSLENRVRGYLDINCAHCHQELAHCSYTPMRFDWEMTSDLENLGVCEPISEPLTGFEFVIKPGNARRSSLYERINSTEVGIMMPLLGRSIVHEEGLQLLGEWIDSLPEEDCVD